MAGTASAAAPPDPAGLLDHCSELKRQLVEFAWSRRLTREDKAASDGTAGTVTDEGEFANLLDRFILQQPLADGRTVVEVFVAEHPGLTDADCQLLLGWGNVVESVFEIRESGTLLARVASAYCKAHRCRPRKPRPPRFCAPCPTG
jgi:hypothetical protein